MYLPTPHLPPPPPPTPQHINFLYVMLKGGRLTLYRLYVFHINFLVKVGA